jgi:hypothetical protein
LGWMELGSGRVPDPHDLAPGILLVGSAASIPSTCLLDRSPGVACVQKEMGYPKRRGEAPGARVAPTKRGPSFGSSAKRSQAGSPTRDAAT